MEKFPLMSATVTRVLVPLTWMFAPANGSDEDMHQLSFPLWKPVAGSVSG